MKQFKIYSTAVLMGVLCQNLSAQNGDDAFRYSHHQMEGTARFNAMGGAFTSLGGDQSAIHINPAAVGVFRSSNISLSPYLSHVGTTSNHLGTENYDDNFIFKFSNIGIVLARENSGSKWRSSNFAVSFNKLADFNRRSFTSGVNTTSSLLDQHRDDLTITGVSNSDPFGSLLAWDAFLVDKDTNTGEFFTQIPNYGQTQVNTLEQKGDLRETVFAYGGNYDDKLYIGGSIGILSARLERTETFQEVIDPIDTNNSLNNYGFTNQLDVDGSGVRASFGFIYRPIPSIRIGASAQSSSNLQMEEYYFTNVSANYDTVSFQYESPDGFFEYDVKTPARYNAGIAYIFKKYGLISVDYGYVDYTKMNLRSEPRNAYDFAFENQGIQNAYTDVHNIKVGAELRVLNPLSLRAGYNRTGNAIVSDLGNNSVTSYSGGFGIAKNKFYWDFATIYSVSKTQKYLYDSAYIKATQIERSRLTFSTTIGFKF